MCCSPSLKSQDTHFSKKEYWAPALLLQYGVQIPKMLDVKESSLWANRKCLMICCVVSIANMQYGFDTAAVGGMQGN